MSTRLLCLLCATLLIVVLCVGCAATDPLVDPLYVKTLFVYDGSNWQQITTDGGSSSGSIWYSGAGAPGAGLGVDGDYYLNSTNGDVYAKAGGSWSVVANIKGPTGANGTTGQGFTWLGAWSSGSNYAAYDVVTYNGSTYDCILAINNSTTTPDLDAAHFGIMAAKGLAPWFDFTHGADVSYVPVLEVTYGLVEV